MSELTVAVLFTISSPQPTGVTGQIDFHSGCFELTHLTVIRIARYYFTDTRIATATDIPVRHQNNCYNGQTLRGLTVLVVYGFE